MKFKNKPNESLCESRHDSISGGAIDWEGAWENVWILEVFYNLDLSDGSVGRDTCVKIYGVIH